MNTSLVSRQAHERKQPDGHIRKSESLVWDWDVPRDVHSEPSTETLYGDLRQYLGDVFPKRAHQNESD